MAADSFERVVADRFRWFRVASGGFRWFAVLVVTVNTIKILKILPKFFNRFLNITKFYFFFFKLITGGREDNYSVLESIQF